MELRVEYIDPDRLKPYAGNARTHSELQVTQIAESMRQFGFVNPILADDHLNVIAGHGRLEAAKKIGMANVPIIRITHLSERQRRALVIADNKIALNSGWNFELLSAELSALVESDFDVSGIGFDEQEISALLQTDQSILPESWDNTLYHQPEKTTYESQTESSVRARIVRKCTCPKCGNVFEG